MKDIVYRLRDVGRGKGKSTGHLQDNEYHMTWRAIIKESFLFCQDEFYSLSNVEKVASSPFLTITVINVLITGEDHNSNSLINKYHIIYKNK